jgi:hypothetical protein
MVVSVMMPTRCLPTSPLLCPAEATRQVVQITAVFLFPAPSQKGFLVEDVHELALVGQDVECSVMPAN